MATRFWVGGSGNWDGVTTTNWAASSNGAGGQSVPTSSDDVTFDSNSGTTATVTIQTATANASTVTINKSDLTLTHSGVGSIVVGAVTLTAGTLNTNGQTCTWGSFSSSNTNVRVLTLGASSITVNGSGTVWNVASTTNMTLNAGTSTITFTSGGITVLPNNGGPSLTYNNVIFTPSATGTIILGSAAIYNNLTYTGTANKIDTLLVGTGTVNNVFTITGSSATNRVFMQGNGAGSPRSWVVNGSVSITNVDFMDIQASGTAGTWTGTSLGDALGNSGITFTAPVTQTWSGNTTGNWSTAANWTSRVPLPQDNATINALTSGTITVDMPRMGANIDFTSSSGGIISFTNTTSFFGSLTLVSAMTVSGSATLTASGRSSLTITMNTKSLLTGGLGISAPGGTYTLADNFSTTGPINVNYGTLTAAANVTCQVFSTNTFAVARTVNMGTGTWTLTGTGKIWDTFRSGLTFNGGTATIVISDATSTARNMVLANDGTAISYPTISYTNAGTGTLSILNASGSAATTINVLNVTGAARVLTFARTGSWVIGTTFNVNGTAGNLVTINSDLGGSAATLSKTGARVSCDYLTLQDLTATGGAAWHAGANSSSVSGVTGWLLTVPPANTGFFVS